MNVTVFGATGAIGQLVVSDLLTAGHEVTAYLRNPAENSAASMLTDTTYIGAAPAISN